MTAATSARADPETRHLPWGLLLPVFVGPFMALLDLSIVTVALPTMQSGLHTGFSSLQWVVDAYTLALSALLLSAGSLGDRYGRRRLYLTGIAIFTLGSAICTASPDIGLLITGRIIQGVGATSLIPGSLSILTQAFPDPARRARMIGLWSGFGALAVAAGPILGGVLVQEVGWWAIFLINLPIGAATVMFGARSIPETSDRTHAATDPAGQVTGIAWLGALTFGLIQSGTHGWTAAVTIVPLAVAAVSFAAFLTIEARSSHPMLPLGLFSKRTFAVANLASFALGFGTYSLFTYLSLYLQDIQGYSAISAGLRYLPLCGAIAVMNVYAGRFTGRVGPRLAITVGYTVAGGALLVLVVLDPGTSYLVIAGAFLAYGTGMGLSITPTTAAAMASVQRQRSGIASGTVNATRQAGNTFGIAVLGSVITAQAIGHLRHALAARHLPGALAQHVATATVTSNGAAPASGTHLSATAIHRLYGSAFASGLHLAVLIAGIVTLLAAALAVVQLRTPAVARAQPPNEQAVEQTIRGAAGANQ
jgi:MFS transporter, DHA2 family, methylenomycin A resistance protein